MNLLIDNYDSFTYNLLQYLGELGAGCRVVRNDQMETKDIDSLGLNRLIVSPGPCTPKEAGISTTAIQKLAGRVPILGVCLGHQCIGAAFGGTIVRAIRPMHGKSSLIFHDGKTVFRGLPNPFPAIRYHSLVVERRSLPAALEISAETSEGEIMGLRHRDFAVEGLQFHPESISTREGKILLKNFLTLEEGGRCSGT